MLRKYVIGIVVVFLAVIAVISYAHSVTIPLLEPAGPIAAQERQVIFDVIALSSIVVVPVFVLLFYFAWRYRDEHPEAHVHHRPDWDHDTPMAEFFWWLVPTVIVVILSVLAWEGSHALDPYKPLPGNDQLEIQVVSLDWKWLFIYPKQGIASVNLVEFPAGVPVHFYLTSDAPMNSFWIPQLAGQIMTMPGMSTQLNLEANRTGEYSGYSANISGKGFAGMAFHAKAVSPQEFQTWVAQARSDGQPLTKASYETLAKPSEYNPVAYYAPVDPSLYNAIMQQYMMPGMSLSHSSTLEPKDATSTSSMVSIPMAF